MSVCHGFTVILNTADEVGARTFLELVQQDPVLWMQEEHKVNYVDHASDRPIKMTKSGKGFCVHIPITANGRMSFDLIQMREDIANMLPEYAHLTILYRSSTADTRPDSSVDGMSDLDIRT